MWGPVRWPGDVAAYGAQHEKTGLQLEDLQAKLRECSGAAVPGEGARVQPV